MIDVRVTITVPVDEDAVAIQVIGYRREGEGDEAEVKAYQGFPDALGTIDELSGSFHEDGWLWQPLVSGQQLFPSIKFPGIWKQGFDAAMRAYSGINESRVQAAWAMGRRSEDRLDAIGDRLEGIVNRVTNNESMANEALSIAKKAASLIGDHITDSPPGQVKDQRNGG